MQLTYEVVVRGDQIGTKDPPKHTDSVYNEKQSFHVIAPRNLYFAPTLPTSNTALPLLLLRS